MIFLLFLLAHLLADFTFQNQKLALWKRDYFSKLLKHLFILYIITLLLSIYFFSIRLLIIILAVTTAHGIIDMIKIRLEKRLEKYGLELFLGDQILHIISLIAIIPWFGTLKVNPLAFGLYRILSTFYPLIHNLDKNIVFFVILIITVIIFNLKASNILISKILEKYKTEVNDSGEKKGMAIGNLERLLLIIFVLFRSYSLIGLLFTAKSLIRFKEVEESEKAGSNFVEYYLIGTFSSILIAIISGLIIAYFRGFLGL